MEWPHYRVVAERILQDLPIIYLYHPKWLYAYTAKLSGFVRYPGGMIRRQGLRRDQGLVGGKMPSICPVDCRWRSCACPNRNRS